MKVACLMGTYGRYTLACEALASFLQQTAVEDATLLVFNQHPEPLYFDHPRVTVINEQMPKSGVRKIRLRMMELCDQSADFVHWWDDDDLYLPWHLEDCLSHIGSSPGWKPHRSWTLSKSGYKLVANNYEASIMYRFDALRAAPIDTHPGYSDHPIFMQLYHSRQLATTEMGDLSSYLYRWATGVPHRSFKTLKTADEYDLHMDEFRQKLTDPGSGEMIVPDLWPHWRAFLDGVRHQVSTAGYEELEARLSIADSMSKLGALA